MVNIRALCHTSDQSQKRVVSLCFSGSPGRGAESQVVAIGATGRRDVQGAALLVQRHDVMSLAISESQRLDVRFGTDAEPIIHLHESGASRFTLSTTGG